MTVREATERNGYVLEHMAEVQVKSVTATIDERQKAHFSDGRLAVDWLSGSYKYGNEVQLNFYTSEKPVLLERVEGHNGWYRVEIHLSPEQALKVVQALK